MQLNEVDYKGGKLVYRTKGEGPLVILLHGFGEDGTIWKNQYDAFSNYQLLIPDLPGSGGSEMIEDMSMEGMADALKAILDGHDKSSRSLPTSQAGFGKPVPSKREGRGGVVLVGHSMGGYITLAFAEKYPEYLNAFGLFHSTAFADSEEKKQTRRKGINSIKQNGAPAFLKTAIPNLYAPVTKEERPGLIEEQMTGVNNFSAEALVSYYEAMIKRPDRTEVLRNSKIPVLFVMGRYDTAVPMEDMLKQCHLPKVSYIHILENSGHNGMIEEVEESNKIFMQFISRDLDR